MSTLVPRSLSACRTLLTGLVAATVLAAASTGAWAEEAEAHGAEPAAEAEHLPNAISVFLGETKESGHDAEFTVGIDYARRVDRLISIGGFVDHAGGDRDSTFVAVASYLHPVGGLMVQFGIGVEHRHGEDDLAGRIGLLYEFELGTFLIAPAVNLDFADGEESLVYGVGLGRRF